MLILKDRWKSNLSLILNFMDQLIEPKTLAKLPEQPIVTAPVNIDPEKEIEFAQRCAKALMKVLETKPRPVIMNGERYIEFEDWQTIARFYQISVGIEWTKTIAVNGKTVGYGARAIVYNRDGQMISSAEAMCMRDENNWKTKPEFQLRSMAQTRASAKAFRNVLAWVVVMAGLKPTPAEEMGDYQPKTTSPQPTNVPTITAPSEPMSVAQKNLLQQMLLQKRGIANMGQYKDFTKKQASNFITQLMNEKITTPEQPAPAEQDLNEIPF